MTMPTSGPISMSMVASELGISASGLSIGDVRCRTLAGKASGTISMYDFYGKSSATGTILIGQASGYSVRGYSESGFGFPAFGGLNSKTVGGGRIRAFYYDYTAGFFGQMFNITIDGNFTGKKLRLTCAGYTVDIPFTSVGTDTSGKQVSLFMGQGTDIFSPRLGQNVPFTLLVV